MKKVLLQTSCKSTALLALAGLALCMQAPLTAAQSLTQVQGTETLVNPAQEQPLPLEERAQLKYDTYILGPGDGLLIELLDLPELSGIFLIGPDGTLYLPRLRSLYVEGLTVEDLRHYLTQKFSKYVLDPQVYVRPVVYRPIRIYVGGEVKRPGYYTLTGAQFTTGDSSLSPASQPGLISAKPFGRSTQNLSFADDSSKATLFTGTPTVFDAIRSAQGITPYSDLSQVHVTRKRGEGLGGGRIRTKLNFLSLITEGNESQNIRLFDGDVVSVSKSKQVMREQLLKAGQSNLSPQFIKVFVSGRVNNPGGITLPQASSLNQAIAMAGGAELIKGKVEFVRFTQEGETYREVFNYDPRAAAGSAKNPLLSAGDLIRVQDSILSATTTVLDEITAPAIGVYTIFSLLEGFK